MLKVYTLKIWCTILPYITQKERKVVDPIIDELISTIRNESLKCFEGLSKECMAKFTTYVIMKLVSELYSRGNWYFMSDAIKCFESAKDEFMQVYVRPYEQAKRAENGAI